MRTNWPNAACTPVAQERLGDGCGEAAGAASGFAFVEAAAAFREAGDLDPDFELAIGRNMGELSAAADKAVEGGQHARAKFNRIEKSPAESRILGGDGME